jgi:hypothetical protein
VFGGLGAEFPSQAGGEAEVQVAEWHEGFGIGREPELLPVAGQRPGDHPAVAREVADLWRVQRRVCIAGDGRVGEAQALGGEAAAVLHALPDDEVGPPLAGYRQQVRDHLPGGDFGQGGDGEFRELGARGWHGRKRPPGRLIGHQPVEPGADVGQAKRLNLGAE